LTCFKRCLLYSHIPSLSRREQSPGSAEKIGGMWDKVASWFRREAGQAHQTTTNSVQQASSVQTASSGK
jgi:hypothetical protein